MDLTYTEMDFHLRPLVETTPSYIQDTTDFLKKLMSIKDLPEGVLLATMDVTSLYTNIPQKEGMEACIEALDCRQNKNPPIEDLAKLMKLILEYNNFSFNGIHYRQLSGTAMGTRMTPSFANLFMSRLETSILSQASVLPLCWWRYSDDIFILWDKSAEDLQDFFEHCNNYHPTIKFTTSVSDSGVNFLDVTVKISEGKISTDLYTKPTDKHLYLLPSSCHPRHCTRSIPKSQALRLRRICSDDATFETRSSELSEHLTKRGYKKPIIKRVIEETHWRSIAMTH